MRRQRLATWKQRAGDLIIRVVDPSFTAPCYFLGVAEAAGKVDLAGMRGITSPAMSHELRGVLERRREWRGAGFACVIDAAGCTDDEQRVAVVLHEFSHTILDPFNPVENLRQMMGETAFTAAMATREQPIGPRATARPWDGHGPDFARIAMHIAARARPTWKGSLCDLYPTDNYLLPGPYSWMGRLEGEPLRLRHLSLAEIIKREPPAEYTQFAAVALEQAEQLFQTQTQG